MKKIISAFLIVFLYTSLDINLYAVRPSSTDIVPDSATAQQIGQILLLRYFGKREA
ncbi:MAG TPA: hypothetical protein PLW09_16485 [Candidatus Kapabacteria bacterium]|nr:hypothetical protein [Candidatus Kapabacteria bacterium]